MKVKMCDPCLAEGALTISLWQSRHKGSPSAISINLCKKHEGFGKGKTPRDYLDLVVRAEATVNKIKDLRGAS